MIKICKKSGEQFEITEKDEEFYRMMDVPCPTLCPNERQRRRLAWRNERVLHKRTCSGTGRTIIGMYPQDTTFPVYDHDYFFSDKWSALSYGRDFDFRRPFFEQFTDLMKVTPRVVNWSVSNENSEYGNLASWNKNCYLCFEADDNRDCQYSDYSFRCVNVLDCSYAVECELCYQCVDILKCYNVRYSLNSKGCRDSCFLKNCIGCSDCFGCVNLQNAQYCFLNEKLGREEYERKINSLALDNRGNVEFLWRKFLKFAEKFPCKYMNGFQNENCTGDYLNNCQNSHFCYDSSELRDCKFVFNCERINNGYDLDTYGGVEGGERLYECQSVGRSVFNVAFGNNISRNLSDIFYSEACWNGKNLFGCISLNYGNYCILNKQYTKDEYIDLRKKIVEHMRKTGEYGEFFPIKDSPFPYNETMAQFYFPLTKEEALKEGYSWRDQEKKEYQSQKMEVPDDVSRVDSSICDILLACQITGKNYKIQLSEWDFYRKMGLPIPVKCPEQRFKERMSLRNPKTLWKRQCARCGGEIETTFSTERKEKILCEKCYLEEVH